VWFIKSGWLQPSIDILNWLFLVLAFAGHLFAVPYALDAANYCSVIMVALFGVNLPWSLYGVYLARMNPDRLMFTERSFTVSPLNTALWCVVVATYIMLDWDQFAAINLLAMALLRSFGEFTRGRMKIHRDKVRLTKACAATT